MPGSPGPSPALSCLAKGGVGGESRRASLPPGLREEGGRKRVGAGASSWERSEAQSQAPAGSRGGRLGQGGAGHRPLPQPQGHTCIAKTHFPSELTLRPPCLRPPLPFPFPESLPSWECQSARCRNLDEQHSLETGSGRWPGQSSRPAPAPTPPPSPPQESSQEKVRAQGLPRSQQLKPAQCRKPGRGGHAGRTRGAC